VDLRPGQEVGGSGSWRVDTLSHDQHQDMTISQEGVIGGSAKRGMISAQSGSVNVGSKSLIESEKAS
jgi:hypothetical protein